VLFSTNLGQNASFPLVLQCAAPAKVPKLNASLPTHSTPLMPVAPITERDRWGQVFESPKRHHPSEMEFPGILLKGT
jgi:hypothetical protein